tara:strand:- start:99 stop:323 length:225 start_codon:yes stop_codon:yes gene_type:complete
MNGSQKLKLNSEDFLKAGRTAALIGLAAVLGSLALSVESIDWGYVAPFVVPVLGAAIDLARRWVRENQDGGGLL